MTQTATPRNAAAPESGPALLPGDRLGEIDEVLYPLVHVCALLSTFAGQHGDEKFTDGVQLEHYAVVFGWIGDQLHDVRLGLEDVHRFVAAC